MTSVLRSPTPAAIMIVADRRLRAMSAPMSPILRRHRPGVDPEKEWRLTDRCLLQTPAIQNQSTPYIARCSCTEGSNPPNGFQAEHPSRGKGVCVILLPSLRY